MASPQSAPDEIQHHHQQQQKKNNKKNIQL